MSFNLTVSPDFTPDHIAGWFIFNTWLQKAIGEGIHLELYNSFEAQRKDIDADKIDMIYANPYDASMLVREKGFLPVATPAGERDEAGIAVSAGSAYETIEDLKEGLRIATTDDPDVHVMGMIMIEPADLNKGNVEISYAPSYVIVAKHVIQGKADAGFFLKEAYDDLSGVIRKQLRELISSQIYVIRHMLLVGPRLQHKLDAIKQALHNMQQDPKGPGVLQALGFEGWEDVSQEDTEFMIDLMETLVD